MHNKECKLFDDTVESTEASGGITNSDDDQGGEVIAQFFPFSPYTKIHWICNKMLV